MPITTDTAMTLKTVLASQNLSCNLGLVQAQELLYFLITIGVQRVKGMGKLFLC